MRKIVKFLSLSDFNRIFPVAEKRFAHWYWGGQLRCRETQICVIARKYKANLEQCNNCNDLTKMASILQQIIVAYQDLGMSWCKPMVRACAKIIKEIKEYKA